MRAGSWLGATSRSSTRAASTAAPCARSWRFADDDQRDFDAKQPWMLAKDRRKRDEAAGASARSALQRLSAC